MERHYVGNDVPIKFDVLVDGKLKDPESVTVSVYGPDSQPLIFGSPTIGDGEVSYVVPHEEIIKEGEYTLIFTLWLRNIGEKSHVVKFKAEPLPVSGEIAEQYEEERSGDSEPVS